MRNVLVFFLITIFAAILPAEETDSQTDTHEDAHQSIHPPRQEQGQRQRRGGRPVMLDINARILEQDQIETLNSEPIQKMIVPSKPVEIKLVGSNLVVLMQFTYIRNEGHKSLVVQGQIWMDIPDQGMQSHISMQTIPFEYDEPILFFPLGQLDEDTANIEVELTLKRLHENN